MQVMLLQLLHLQLFFVRDEIRKEGKPDTMIMVFTRVVGKNGSKVDTIYNTYKVE